MFSPRLARHQKGLLVGVIAGMALLLTFVAVSAQGPRPELAEGPTVALGTGFTYQGQLKSSGAPVNGACDIAFRLYDAATVGASVGSALTQTVGVTNGLFTTALDFGAGAFNGNARWLDMQVRCPAGSGAFAALNPRQALTAAPYALYSAAPWLTSGSNLYYNAGNVGIGTAFPMNSWS